MKEAFDDINKYYITCPICKQEQVLYYSGGDCSGSMNFKRIEEKLTKQEIKEIRRIYYE